MSRDIFGMLGMLGNRQPITIHPPCRDFAPRAAPARLPDMIGLTGETVSGVDLKGMIR